MTYRHRVLWLLMWLACSVPCFSEDSAAAKSGDRDVLSLAGVWRFRLDPKDIGHTENWIGADFADEVRLPGSTDENHVGAPTPTDVSGREAMQYLTRRYKYVGPAWYQREVEIPAAWKGKRVVLFLERCHWETQVWVDGTPMGSRNSLCVPHEYDLSRVLAPGKHRLTICVDNRLKIDVGPHGHSVSEHTQTNWNGIVGRLELVATEPVWVGELQVYPDVKTKVARVKATVVNATAEPITTEFTLESRLEAAKQGPPSARVAQQVTCAPGSTAVALDLPMGDDVRLWDEFAPDLYELTAGIGADRKAVVFGMREFGTNGTQFAINGRTRFLRGTLECCIFPLTGYPSMDVEAWMRICRILKSYGLNHLRFHSWCPPEAAFAAADRSGVVFHVETPMWVDGAISNDPVRVEFIRAEFRRILDTYGNHPSFAMMCLGNELGRGDDPFLEELVGAGKKADPRHLYACATRPSQPKPFDDYYVTHKTSRGWVRGQGRFYDQPPSTQVDYRDAIAGIGLPVVSHEIGQWTIYPNFDEIGKYTGVVWPRNFELIRESLAAHHMLDQAHDFFLASGKLMVLLYREEIESALRTPGFGGFQLLDLRDFPGQGTALVGTLDPFWDSKGLIEPDQFRRYCGATVPLVRMAKRTWTSDETFTATADVAHYGPQDFKGVTPRWTIRDGEGRTLASGQLASQDIAAGGLRALGSMEIPLKTFPAPAKVRIELTLEGTGLANDWEFWIYPPHVDTDAPAGVVVCRSWKEAKGPLAAGGRVLLLPHLSGLAGAREGRFTPVFWSPIWFSSTKTSTMGMLCDPSHPALAQFPTEFHSNWQWWDLAIHSRPISLGAAPPEFRPVVQAIDNFTQNEKLGLVFEAAVGPGRVVVSTIDLANGLDAGPAARQLRHSLLAYMASDGFRPKGALEPAVLEKLIGTD